MVDQFSPWFFFNSLCFYKKLFVSICTLLIIFLFVLWLFKSYQHIGTIRCLSIDFGLCVLFEYEVLKNWQLQLHESLVAALALHCNLYVSTFNRFSLSSCQSPDLIFFSNCISHLTSPSHLQDLVYSACYSVRGTNPFLSTWCFLVACGGSKLWQNLCIFPSLSTIFYWDYYILLSLDSGQNFRRQSRI